MQQNKSSISFQATIKKMKEQLELQDNEIKELTLQKNMSIGYLASSGNV